MTSSTKFALLATLVVSNACMAGDSTKRCQRFGFSGKVEAGQAFRKSIGDQLIFALRASSEAGGGWTFEIGSPEDEDPLYIYDVNPPYRARSVTYLDISYGTPAREAVSKGSRNFWFVLDKRGAHVASEAVRQLLFSDATQSDAVSISQLNAVRKGRGVFRIVDSAVVSGTITRWDAPLPPQYSRGAHPDKSTIEALYGRILRIAFEVELTVPADFTVPASFHSTNAPCPGPWMGKDFLQWSR